MRFVREGVFALELAGEDSSRPGCAFICTGEMGGCVDSTCAAGVGDNVGELDSAVAGRFVCICDEAGTAGI